MNPAGVCDACLRRSWLLERLSGNLEVARGRIGEVLGLSDADLIGAVAGARRAEIQKEFDEFDRGVADRARTEADQAGLELICCCNPAYPQRLLETDSAPAVLHAAGGAERFLALCDQDPVAIVGSRAASAYGLEVARALARDLAAAGTPVISGMALGIDSAAHLGTLDAGGATIAVLPAAAHRPYPRSKHRLHAEILRVGAAVSEVGPRAATWRWSFPARNRIIAGLASITIVVEAGLRSGAMLTAGLAREADRPVGAVPGQVTSPHAAGPNGLLATGAVVIRDAQDVLDALYGAGVRSAVRNARPVPTPPQEAVLAAIAAGNDTAATLGDAGIDPQAALVQLAALELAGWIRRGPGGRYTVVP